MGASAKMTENPGDDDKDVPMVLGISAMPVETATATTGRAVQSVD